MKRTLIYLLFSLMILDVFAQPQAISYQAIVRNVAGVILQNQNVTVRFSILADSVNGSLNYQETHQVQTNQFGLINLQIGKGTVITGIFSSIDWGSHLFFCEVEIDINGGSNFTQTGTFQFLSVPYSLYSESSAYSLVARGKNSIQTSRQYNVDKTDGDTIYFSTQNVLLSPKKVTYFIELTYITLDTNCFTPPFKLYLTGTWYNSNGDSHGISIWGNSTQDNDHWGYGGGNYYLFTTTLGGWIAPYGDHLGDITFQCHGESGPSCKHQYFMTASDSGIVIYPHVADCSSKIQVNGLIIFLQAE